MKKILFSLFIFTLVLGVAGSFESKALATGVSSDIDTPEKYVQYLKDQHVLDHPTSSFSMSAVQPQNENVNHVEAYIQQFENLPRKQQEKFVSYLNDPKFFEDLFNHSDSQSEGVIEIEGYEGNVSIVNEMKPSTENFFAVNAMGRTNIYSFDHYRTYKAFGLDLVKTVIYMQIEVKEMATNTRVVDRVLQSYGAISYNYYPPAVLTKTELIPAISSDKYKATKIVLWQWNFLWKNLGFTAGTFEQTLVGNKAGTGYFSERKL